MASEGPRFLTPADVAEILAISPSQVLRFLRDRELRGIKLPGKGEWRIERSALEEFISTLYEQTQGNDHAPTESTQRGARRTST